LTDFMEITAALEKDYMDIVNQLFSKIVIPAPILEDETIDNNLGSLQYEEGTFSGETGYSIFMELGKDSTANQLSEYDRHVIAIAGESSLLVVSNDKPVREICREYDIEVTGTLGVISSAYENDLISFAQMEETYKFLFSEDSSCYLSNKLKKRVYNYYSIESE
ncbi:MAG: hypothetical protein ACOCRB_01065, partial [Halanaerobiaceae bacterium]